MTFTNLLVHVDATPHSDGRVQLAAALAKRLNARLTGLYVVEPDPVEIVLPPDVEFTGGALAQAHARSEARQGHGEAQFAESLRQTGVAGEWRLARGDTRDTVLHWARRSDLVVAGQSDPDDALDTASAIAIRALLGSGRPVLTVPYAGRFDTVGNNVVVAWKETREAVRALNDALPLLQGAATVTLLTITPTGEERPKDGTEGDRALIAHLARHGVKTSFTHVDGGEISAGEMLLNRCFDLGADLLVCGGYGHSQLQELILGGVTRTLFEQMTLPVMMSH